MSPQLRSNLLIRAVRESELPDVERVVRIAFGTRMGFEDPASFAAGSSWRSRWIAEPQGIFAAFDESATMIAAVYAITWGSFGFFGPLGVLPEHQGQGVAKLLLDPVMQFFAARHVKHEALYTFSDSVQHVALYQKFGYWPRFLTALMTKQVDGAPNSVPKCERYSRLGADERAGFVRAARELTGGIYAGLDLDKEIQALDCLAVGDILFVEKDGKVQAFAV
ncbi:MAG: GNAT family N-acetyltransferase, partial [Terriglobales bacterium]